MNSERKSKRQERRERMRRQERNRLIMIGSIAAGAVLLVLAVAWPYINQAAEPTAEPIPEVVAVDPGTHPNANDNSMGDPNASILIEEFSDFQCPYCKNFHEQTEPLLQQYFIDTGKVRLVYRSMGNFVSDNLARSTGGTPKTESQDAALAMYCAGDQDLFWEMHAHLFANVAGEDVGSFTDERIQEIAETTGLAMAQFNSCYDSGKYEERVQQDYADGQAAGVNGTPGFLITYTVNGETRTQLLEGAQPFDVFQQTLETILDEIEAQ